MPAKNTCPYAYKFKGKGRTKVYDPRHRCVRSCQWSGQDALDWFRNTPYPGQSTPPIQVYHDEHGVKRHMPHCDCLDCVAKIRVA